MVERPERLFLFVQCELPWALGPADGRYLLRSRAGGEPEHVIVLGTLGAGRAAFARGAGPLRRRAATRRREALPEPKPTPVEITRVTIVDPVSLSAERQARAWLEELDTEREVSAAFAALNRVLYAQRIAAADPYEREVSPAQALVIRAGWGEGEQVASGLWLHAVALPWTGPRARAPGHRRPRRSPVPRAGALRADERLAELLGAREEPLLCEELALRARLDLDQGRLAHAAIELDRALLAALSELACEQRADLPLRVAELQSLHAGVAESARAALSSGAPEEAGEQAAQPSAPKQPGDEAAGHAPGRRAASEMPERVAERLAERLEQSHEEAVRHALGRLEAALRARTAAGFNRS
ncbi:MAG TPA: hypothetical protein VJ996_00515 [Solirubrobacteraceae bacterium]|nr:hypothetical protein [Solirubrobacteraceae bacterium]